MSIQAGLINSMSLYPFYQDASRRSCTKFVSDPNSSRACAFTAARSDQESGQNCLKVPEYPHYSHWLVLGPKWTKTGRSVSLPAGSPLAKPPPVRQLLRDVPA